MMKKTIVILLSLCLLFIFYKNYLRCIHLEYKVTHSDRYLVKMKQFSNAIKKRHQKVWIGDSILMGMNIDSGDEVNISIGGETITTLLERLQMVQNLNSKKINLLIGINDVLFGQQKNIIISRLEKLLDYLVSKNNQVTIISILPVNVHSSIFLDNQRSNVLIEEINTKIASLLVNYQNNENQYVKFVNTHDLFLKDNVLSDKYTSDGVHLSKLGYKVLQTKLFEQN